MVIRPVTKLLEEIWCTLEQGSGSENEEKFEGLGEIWGEEWIGFGDC